MSARPTCASGNAGQCSSMAVCEVWRGQTVVSHSKVSHSKVLSVEKGKWKYGFDWLKYCFAIVLAMGQSFTYTFCIRNAIALY